MTLITLPLVRVAVLALLAAPVAAGAQLVHKPARIGILYCASTAFRPDADPADAGFVAGLRAHGYIVGRNVGTEFRSAEGSVDRFSPLSAELVRLGVDLIVVTLEPAVRAVQATSATIPIVMAGASRDPWVRASSPAWPARAGASPGSPWGTSPASAGSCSGRAARPPVGRRLPCGSHLPDQRPVAP